MDKLVKKLIPDEGGWFNGLFKSHNDLFNAFDRLSEIFYQRYQKKAGRGPFYGEGIFLLKKVEVRFFRDSRIKNKYIEMDFGSSTLIVNVPDKENWTEQMRAEVRGRELLASAPLLKESQVRMMALLFTLVSPSAKTALIKSVKSAGKKSKL